MICSSLQTYIFFFDFAASLRKYRKLKPVALRIFLRFCSVSEEISQVKACRLTKRTKKSLVFPRSRAQTTVQSPSLLPTQFPSYCPAQTLPQFGAQTTVQSPSLLPTQFPSYCPAQTLPQFGAQTTVQSPSLLPTQFPSYCPAQTFV